MTNTSTDLWSPRSGCFRAFDKSAGALLWETILPLASKATPITCEVDGKQSMVIAADGGKDLKSKS